jgi:hypothetical protein
MNNKELINELDVSKKLLKGLFHYTNKLNKIYSHFFFIAQQPMRELSDIIFFCDDPDIKLQ